MLCAKILNHAFLTKLSHIRASPWYMLHSRYKRNYVIKSHCWFGTVEEFTRDQAITEDVLLLPLTRRGRKDKRFPDCTYTKQPCKNTNNTQKWSVTHPGYASSTTRSDIRESKRAHTGMVCKLVEGLVTVTNVVHSVYYLRIRNITHWYEIITSRGSGNLWVLSTKWTKQER